MRNKIDVFHKEDKPIHRWNKYNTVSEEQDRYDLYFKNRYKILDAYEKYPADSLAPLDKDYVLAQEFEKTKGNNNVVWKFKKPEIVQYDALYEGFKDFEGTEYMKPRQYRWASNNVLGIDFINLPSGWRALRTQKDTREIYGDANVYKYYTTFFSSSHMGNYTPTGSNNNYYYLTNYYKKSLATIKLENILEYDGFIGPYSDDVEYGVPSQVHYLWVYYKINNNEFVSWDSPALTRAGSVQYHTKTRIYIEKSGDMVIGLSSDLWDGWKTYLKPESTIVGGYDPIYDSNRVYSLSPNSLFKVKDKRVYKEPIKYDEVYNSLLENNFLELQFNKKDNSEGSEITLDWNTVKGSDNPETSNLYQCTSLTYKISDEQEISFQYVYRLDDMIIQNDSKNGMKICGYEVVMPNNYLVKLSGKLTQFKFCIYGMVANAVSKGNISVSNGSPIYTESDDYYTNASAKEVISFPEEKTGWRYYDISELDSFEYDLVDDGTLFSTYGINGEYAILSQKRGWQIPDITNSSQKVIWHFKYRPATSAYSHNAGFTVNLDYYEDDILVYTTPYFDASYVYRGHLLYEYYSLFGSDYGKWSNLALYCAKTWDYSCFESLETKLTSSSYVAGQRVYSEHESYYTYNSDIEKNLWLKEDYTCYIPLYPIKDKTIWTINNNRWITGYYSIPDWVAGNGENIYYVPSEKEVWRKWIETETATVEEFEQMKANLVNSDILDFTGRISSKRILADTVRYGFTYPTVSYSIGGYQIYLGYIQQNSLEDYMSNMYTNKYYKPFSYTITSVGDYYDIKSNLNDNYDWHVLGIAADANYYNIEYRIHDGKKDYYSLTPMPSTDFIVDDVDFIPIYYIKVIKHDAYDCYSYYNNYLPVDVQDSWEPINPNDYLQNIGTVNIWHMDKTKLVDYLYMDVSEYNVYPNRWLTYPLYYFKAGTYVPTSHWPQMIYSKDHFDDVEYVKEKDAHYSTFGYEDGESILANYLPEVPPEYAEGENFYRFIKTIKEYYTTSFAGTIYVPIGTNPEEKLYLTNLEPSEIEYQETNLYGYKYMGTENVVNKNMIVDVVTSEDFGSYPKDGLYSDGFWYEYIGTNELLIDLTWDDDDLRSTVRYNLDINSSEDFTIGDVAGASFTVDVQGNVRDNIQYLGRKCNLYFDFKNSGLEKYFGTFTIDSVVFTNHQVSTITAYDNIKKFDTLVYEYLSSELIAPLYPMTAKTLFQLMCEYCEVPYYTNMEFLNSDKLCYGPFGDANLTARQVLSYIAEIAGGYIVCDTDGYAVIKTHKPYRDVNPQSIYSTDYENIISIYVNNGQPLSIDRTVYELADQSSQRMNIFPTEMIDSTAFNNADTETFICFRNELNAIYDLSDNPFLTYITNAATADTITNAILDQIAMLAPEDELKFYAGEIQIKDIDLDDFGNKQIVKLLNKQTDLFVPTTISISSAGITLTGKGQAKYSTKIANSELAKQVNSLKISVKEMKLSIPDALNQTLEEHSEDINSLQSNLSSVETNVSTLQSNLSTVQGNLSSVESALAAQGEATTQQFSTVNARDDGQDARLDAIEAWDAATTTALGNINTSLSDLTTATTSLETTVGVHSTSISNIETNYATKTYAEGLNQVQTITNGWKLKIGEDEVSFYSDNGYLFISDGTTTWKLLLEVNE